MNTASASLEVVAEADIRIGAGRSRRFEGVEHSADISYFYVENQPGEGPGMHWHPYSETWVVLEGTAHITCGTKTYVATPGDTATVAPRVPHRFVNAGNGVLRILCIHASAIMIQTFLDED